MKLKQSLASLGFIGVVFLLACFIIVKLLNASSQDISDKESGFSTSGGNTVELTQKRISSSKMVQSAKQCVAIEDAVTCLNIRDQKPVGIVSQITSNVDRIYCWAKVINGKGQKIRYIWYFNGKAYFSQWQIVISQRFRTWCSYNIASKARGNCYVEIVSQTGQVLARVDFKILVPPLRSRTKHL